MKNLIFLLWFGTTCQMILAQNYKPLQISEMKIGNFYYPVHFLLDNENNSYFVNWTGNGQIISDTVFIHKLSNEGKLIKTFKINSLYGGMPNTAFQKLGSGKFILAIGFTDSVKVQDHVYKVRYNQNGQVGVQGSMIIVLNKNLEILRHKFIGLGINHYIQSIPFVGKNQFLLGMRFSDTLDTRPCGGDLFVVSEKDTIIGEHLNFALAELDTNFIFKKIIRSNSLGHTEDIGNSGNIISQKISAVSYSREDTLRVNNSKFKPELNFTPLLFKLNKDLSFAWTISGKKSDSTTFNDDGNITCIIEDKDKNFILVQNTLGKFNFGTTEIGKFKDLGTAFVKFDSLGNIIWTKTISTSSGVGSSSEINLNPQRDKFLYTNALQDTFSIGNYNFSIPRGDQKKFFIAEFDLEGNVKNVIILGYTQFANGIDYMAAQMDSVGNIYALFTTKGTGAFQQDCFQLPALSSLQNDSSRLVWLKFGPSTLKKESILKQWDICTGQGQIKAFYKTKYPDLQYKWNTQTVDSNFTFSQGGNYRLIVKDATCYADTNYFNFAPRAIIASPTITGENQANNIGSFLYRISIPDSLQINWQVAGGQIVSGQGTDSVYVNWLTSGLGLVSYTLTGLQSGCQRMDTLNVLITSNNSIIRNSSQFRIYPNPTDNLITISSLGFNNTYFNLSNFLGQSLMDGFIENGTKQLDLTNLESGIYILNLNSTTTKETVKIIKKLR